MPKKTGKKKVKKKSSKSADEHQTTMQLGSIPNRTMVQHMASETLSVAGSSRGDISSRERVRIKKKKENKDQRTELPTFLIYSDNFSQPCKVSLNFNNQMSSEFQSPCNFLVLVSYHRSYIALVCYEQKV